MGAYLSEPNTNKESIDDDSNTLSYGASSMQGWRIDQEDAHNSILNFDLTNNTSFFAVYDGHGGSEVAEYCAKYLPDYLKNLDEYKNGNLEEALRKVFLKFDESLLTPEAQKELKDLREMNSREVSVKDKNLNEGDDDGKNNKETVEGEENGSGEQTPDDYESETAKLYDEATMPLEEVLKRYSNTENKIKKALRKKGVLKAGPTSSKANKSNVEEDKPASSPADFQEQEEIDINEIKKNSHKLPDEVRNHEQDYDEASNLGEVSDSQKSSLICESSALQECDSMSKSVLVNSTGEAGITSTSSGINLANSNSITPGAPTMASATETCTSSSKAKLNKEEIKLSPIRKKSLSSSLLIDDISSIKPDATVLNGTNGTTSNDIDEENKENDNMCNSSNQDPNKVDDKKDSENNTTTVCSSSNNNNNNNNNTSSSNNKDDTTKTVKAKSKKLSNTNLIAKFIAGVVNSKLRQGMKNKNGKIAKKSKESIGKSEDNDQENDDEEDEDDDYEAENKDEDDDEEDDYNDEDENEEDEDEDDENDDDDDDEDDDDDDYEEEDDEEDEEYDVDANQGVGIESRPGYDSGCTAVVALLRDNKQLYVANAGDSRCVVCRDGKAVDMSFDHKPEDDIERERIEKAGGNVTKDGRVNNGLNLSRAIGDHSYKANKNLPLSEQMITSLPDLKFLEIDPKIDKFMVLACDGIWNFMSSQEVCDYIQERLNANYSKLSQICEELFMHCLAPDSEGDGTGCDNMTCIVVTFYPFRKINLKLSNSALESLISNKKSDEQNESDKISLKRAHENGNDDNVKEIKIDNTDDVQSNLITKKLKQEESHDLNEKSIETN